MVPLTAFFAEDEEKLRGRLLHPHVHVRHQANQLVPQHGAHLWPDLHVLQRWKHLEAETVCWCVAQVHGGLVQAPLFRLLSELR